MAKHKAFCIQSGIPFRFTISLWRDWDAYKKNLDAILKHPHYWAFWIYINTERAQNNMNLLTENDVAQLFDLNEGLEPTQQDLDFYFETLDGGNVHPTPH